MRGHPVIRVRFLYRPHVKEPASHVGTLSLGLLGCPLKTGFTVY